jgi:fumarylacetoacetase
VFNLTIQPNWYAMPSVYNGRTSSLVVSGTPFHRPCGMYPDARGSGSPQVSVPISFKPESHMDYELEMAVWLSKPVPRGHRLKIANAQDHIFGLTLLNDWSARQIQGFEMPPLGPFHAKGSCTSVSSWIVPIEALEKVAQCSRKTKQEPPPPPHLTWQDDAAAAATYDIDLTVKLLSMSSPSHHAAMNRAGRTCIY